MGHPGKGSLLLNGKRAQFYSIAGGPLGLKDRHPEWFREDLTRLFELLAEGRIKPVIAERLPLEDAAHAHELIEHAQIQGKLVLIPNVSCHGAEYLQSPDRSALHAPPPAGCV